MAKLVRKFRVLEGQHIQVEKKQVRRVNEDGSEEMVLSEVNVKYHKGDVCENTTDLCQRLNAPGMTPKFEYADGGPIQTNPFLTQPAPGETEEEFQVRQARLRGDKAPPVQVADTDLNAPMVKSPDLTVIPTTATAPPPSKAVVPTKTVVPAAAQKVPPKPLVTNLPAANPSETLNSMSVDQLKKYAAEEEIEVAPTAISKEAIIAAIQQAQAQG